MPNAFPDHNRSFVLVVVLEFKVELSRRRNHHGHPLLQPRNEALIFSPLSMFDVGRSVFDG